MKLASKPAAKLSRTMQMQEVVHVTGTYRQDRADRVLLCDEACRVESHRNDFCCSIGLVR